MVSNFVPEIWSANINEHLRAKLVFAALCNNNYEGDIAAAGDTVHITKFDDPTIGDYTAENDITVESIDDSSLALTVDQAKYFAFDVDDVTKRQAINGWVESVTQGGAYGLANAADAFVSAAMYAGVHNTANDLSDQTADISDNTGYAILVNLRKQLVKSNVPADGRWVVVPPELYAALLQDNRFINAQASADGGAALRNGLVGRAAGFDVYESNTVPQVSTGIFNVIAGHGLATTFASQINSVEAQRREKRFGDLVKGLYLFGAKVVKPEALAMASVTVQA